MITDALRFIAADLRGPLGLDAHSLRLSDRPAMATGPHHALITLVAARESGAHRTAQRPVTGQAVRDTAASPLELDLLFSFGGSDYTESLELLTRTIAHLSERPVWTSNSPAVDGATPFPASLEQLILHPVALSLEDQHHLWATLGAPHMPSMLYRATVVARR